MPQSIRTFSGIYINVFKPDLNDILIEDIAHALSMQCRFGGHTQDFYSVAEHSIWVSNQVSKEFKLEALLHDASEAYLVDIPKPIKRGLDDYNQVEEILMSSIAEKFNINFPFNKNIKVADNSALEYEWKNKVLKNNFKSMSQKQAKDTFLKMFKKYSKC